MRLHRRIIGTDRNKAKLLRTILPVRIHLSVPISSIFSSLRGVIVVHIRNLIESLVSIHRLNTDIVNTNQKKNTTIRNGYHEWR